jgi:PEP-CTERM motif
MPSCIHAFLSCALLALPVAALAQTGPAAGVPAIPEPAALALFVLGVGVVGAAIRRRQS